MGKVKISRSTINLKMCFISKKVKNKIIPVLIGYYPG